MKFVREEEFEKVIKSAEALDKAWRGLLRQNPLWDGLGLLIGYDYLDFRVTQRLKHRMIIGH